MYLAIETSSLVSSVALGNEEKLLGELTVAAGLTHSEQLVPHIAELMKQCGQEGADIEGIVVSCGPGSFTGLRIGMGTAKALAYAWDTALYGVMTMDAIAHNFYGTAGTIVVWIDGQKRNVYEARYQWVDGDLTCTQAPTVKHRDEALSQLSMVKAPIVFAGDGAQLYAEDIAASGLGVLAPPSLQIPRASALLSAAWKNVAAGKVDDPMSIVPYYIRQSEAERMWEERHPERVGEENPTVVVTETADEVMANQDGET